MEATRKILEDKIICWLIWFKRRWLIGTWKT